MIKIKNISLKNFQSVGAVMQSVDFDQESLTLVLGTNIDMGGDGGGHRNAVGKTTLINALSYALYGNAISNIRKDNLINRTNAKNMLVTIDFKIDTQEYRIERGRKPNILKFYVNGNMTEATSADDDAQGDSRETQNEITKILKMSHDMFKHVVALNTYTEPFLDMRANDQRLIIEQLLGITLLSEKADQLKIMIKNIKDTILEEEYRIKAITEANKRITEQVNNLERRQTDWANKKNHDLKKLQEQLSELQTLDIDKELENHKNLETWINNDLRQKEVSLKIKALKQKLNKELLHYQKLSDDLTATREHKCYACGQELHDEMHGQILETKEKAMLECETILLSTQDEIDTLSSEVFSSTKKPVVFYKSVTEAMKHMNSVERLNEQILSKTEEIDPYADQISEMRNTAIETISYEYLNELVRIKEHQDFLLKLLTNKDSFVRKTIIDQNLSYLNSRLEHYLQQTGLPHTVVFQNDLTVQIEELGRELDFDNLSRGEQTRVIVSLSLSFRDVWEGLYQSINLLFIDELVDVGLDQSGVDNIITILKKLTRDRSKSVWLVSHRDDLRNRVDNILNVIKESGFTTYEALSESIT